MPINLPEDTITKKLTSASVFNLDKVLYNLGSQHGYEQVLIITDGDQPGDPISVTDLDG